MCKAASSLLSFFFLDYASMHLTLLMKTGVCGDICPIRTLMHIPAVKSQDILPNFSAAGTSPVYAVTTLSSLQRTLFYTDAIP